MLSGLRRLFAASDLLAFNVRNRDRWIAEQAAGVPAGSKVLDVGAGSAPYRSLFAHCEYKTQDFAQLKDDQLRHGGYAPIDFVSDANAIPVSDASFDVVLCTEVLEHVPEPIVVVREFGRIVAPGGRLILTAPLGSGIHQEPFHFYGGFTPYWYERFLAAAGFEAITMTANNGTLRHVGQETIRFARMTRPFSFAAPGLTHLVWLPAWLLLAPILLLAVPLAAKWLDATDRERRFTVGYHVTATRKAEP
ncbi:class I SAM-dependent methyltransferase [Methylocystis sp. B8]|uniref:class I SAM-dependent methyltransferase n=1 Tax=Methylocystis sp. B8 TaxID=544938 RepID=UPI0010FE7137|nr:class I SAM-dependent methyltransferase [Methylocystis sp. B8]TLG77628.1 class I SAM-dependent methyltransferase [Methylocystis sp. B8]